MTVLVAVLDSDRGVVSMAGDRRISIGNAYQRGPAKIFRKGHALVGLSGSPRFRRAVQAMGPLRADEDGLTVEAVDKWVAELSAHVRGYGESFGHGSMSGNARMHDAWMLVATLQGLWTIESCGGSWMLPGGLAAQGSGWSEALAVLHALREANMPQLEPRALVTASVRAVTAINRSCGDGVDVLTIDSRGLA